MKKLLTFILAICMGISMVGCGNRDIVDTVYSFDKGIVCLADGTVVEGEVEKWRDYENSDMIQVTINGATYLTHISNMTLINYI